MSDPFPLENNFDKEFKFVKSSETEHLVYPEQRYKEDETIYCIYIPRREIMIKIMRSCIGIK